jgi:hypothetical protein
MVAVCCSGSDAPSHRWHSRHHIALVCEAQAVWHDVLVERCKGQVAHPWGAKRVAAHLCLQPVDMHAVAVVSSLQHSTSSLSSGHCCEDCGQAGLRCSAPCTAAAYMSCLSLPLPQCKPIVIQLSTWWQLLTSAKMSASAAQTAPSAASAPPRLWPQHTTLQEHASEAQPIFTSADVCRINT